MTKNQNLLLKRKLIDSDFNMFFFDINDKLKFTPRSVEHAYLSILNDDLNTAQAVFESIDSPRAKWGCALISIILGYIEIFPTYFQIRNFYEIDLDFLIKNEKFEYVEMLLSSLKLLSQVNQEVYKYTARVMFVNKMMKAAGEYLDKSKNLFFNDPEMHFLYSKYFLELNNLPSALMHIEECLKILPDYYPAKELKRKCCSN